jgi:hypothetical protein
MDKLIKKEQTLESKLDKTLEGWLQPVFKSHCLARVIMSPSKHGMKPSCRSYYPIRMAAPDEGDVETHQWNDFYKILPDSYNLVVNSNHPLILSLAGD